MPLLLPSAAESLVELHERQTLVQLGLPSSNGKSLHAVWKHWDRLGDKSGRWVYPGITADVHWELRGTTLTRTDAITSNSPVQLRRFELVIPSTADQEITTTGNSVYELRSHAGTLAVFQCLCASCFSSQAISAVVPKTVSDFLINDNRKSAT